MNAKEFNESFPVRTKVIYTNSLGGKRVTSITSPARVMFGGAIVCHVAGVSGEIDINRLEKVTPEVQLKQLKTVNTEEEFNLLYPVGSKFRYYPTKGRDEYREVVTRSTAWKLGCHEVVVAVEGIAGGVSIHHLEAMEAAE